MLVVDRTCEHCGGDFVTKASRLRDGRRGRFCSPHCSRRASMLRRHSTCPQIGAANPNWKGGVSRFPYRYTRRFRVRYPEKHAAQQLVHEAVASGRLIRPDCCSQCAVGCEPHGHHDDYTQPLDVRWLCGRCHREHHRAERAAAAVMNAIGIQWRALNPVEGPCR